MDRLQEHEDIQRHVSSIELLGKRGDKRVALTAYIEQHRLPAKSFLILDDDDLGDDLRQRQIRTRSEDGIRDIDGVLYAIKGRLEPLTLAGRRRARAILMLTPRLYSLPTSTRQTRAVGEQRVVWWVHGRATCRGLFRWWETARRSKLYMPNLPKCLGSLSTRRFHCLCPRCPKFWTRLRVLPARGRSYSVQKSVS